MADQPLAPNLLIRPEEVVPFDRGNGVVTVPYVGRWNCETNRVTTGQTRFAPGTGLPLHSHNVEESVLVLEGEAVAEIGDQRFDLVAGDATWVPAGVPHRFVNRGEGTMRIFDTIWDICERSKKLDAPTYKVADILVEEKLAAAART